MDVALTGLRAGHAIAFLDIEGQGGGQWQFGGGAGVWQAYLAQSAGATTANVFFQPGAAETGRPFQVTIRYDDGQQATFAIQGGSFDPSLKIAAPQPSPSTPQGPIAASPPTASKTAPHLTARKPVKKVVKAPKVVKTAPKAAARAALVKALNAMKALKAAARAVKHPK